MEEQQYDGELPPEEYGGYDNADGASHDADGQYDGAGDEEDDSALHSTFAERNATMQLENNMLKNQVATLSAQLEPVQADLRRRTQEVNRAKAELEAERAAVDTLTEELQSAKADAAQENSSLREELEGLRAVLEEEKAVELQKLRSELDFAKAQGDNKHWKSEKAELLDQVDDLNSQLRAAKKHASSAAAAAATPAAVPEAVPGISIDPAEVESMLAESATEIRHLQGQVDHWKREAAKAAEAAKTAAAAAAESAAAAASSRPEAVVAEADMGTAAELKALREQQRAAEVLQEEQEALQQEQLDALRKVHSAEVAKLNKQILGLRGKLSVQPADASEADAPQLTPSKGAKKAGGSAADPLLREQQKLKKQLSDLRRELMAKKDETRKLEAEIGSLKEEGAKARKARAAEKKRWQADQDALREQVERAQSADGDMLAQVEAIAEQTRSLSADVALWQERAASEKEAKEKLQAHLDELARAGKAAANHADRNLPDGDGQLRPPLLDAVEEAVHAALSRDEHSYQIGSGRAGEEDEGGGSATRRRLVNSLAKTEVMARRLKAMAAEVEASVAGAPGGEEWQVQGRSPLRDASNGY
jgi:hypothetical protein